MKSIKAREFFKIVNPEYVYLKLTPTNSVRNYDSDKIAKAISSLYINIRSRIRKIDKQRFIYKPSKVAYFMYVEKNKVEFYFIIPKTHINLIKDKIGDTWKGITTTQVDKLPTFSDEAIKYYLTYKKEDPLSLSVDRRTNTLLSSSMNVIDVMEEGDKIGILYNFIPTTQFTWRANYENTMKKLKENKPIDREKFNKVYIGKMLLNLIIEVFSIITDAASDALGVVAYKNNQESLADVIAVRMNARELKQSTINKKESTVLETQIAIISESKDKNRKDNNAMAVIQSFKSITDDNELIHKKLKSNYNVIDYRIPQADSFKTSTLECQNFLALPGKELLEQYNFIDKIDTFESKVPEELQKGIMSVGENTYKGQITKAYLTEDRELRNLTVAVIGPTRAGKTTLFQNLVKNAIDNGECVIIPDFISWCKFSYEISQVIPKHKQLVIDYEDFKNLEGFGFNELWIADADPITRYDSSKRQTAQLLTLVDSVNDADKSLSAKMDRYLEAAALIVFSSYGSLNDVFDVLKNHKVRHEYLDKINKDLFIYLEEYKDTLLELDEVDKKTNEIFATKLNLVAGILDRVNRLKRNTAMELMLKNNCNKNINLLEEIQKPQLIIIRMPDSSFSTETEKDFVCTYWLSKIWLTLQLRDTLIKDRIKRVKVNLIWDELSQIPFTTMFLREKLSQIAKFDAKNIISCHYLGQKGMTIIRDELKAANSSYLLLSGCDKDNFKELKEELYPYELDDLLNLKRYHSLNLIKYEQGWAKFITKLPKPI